MALACFQTLLDSTVSEAERDAKQRRRLGFEARVGYSKLPYPYRRREKLPRSPSPTQHEFGRNGLCSRSRFAQYGSFGYVGTRLERQNTEAKGNTRDHATAEQLLANLENLNAEFIKQGIAPQDSLQRLNEFAIYQINLLTIVQNKIWNKGKEARLLPK